MLKKCLKHDLKYVFEYWVIATAIFTVVSFLGAICLRTNRLNEEFQWYIMCGIVVFFLGSVAYEFFGAGMSIYRAYQSCFTDEGYLTFTLPIKRQTLLVSKVLSIIISFVASVAVMAILYHGVFAIVPSNKVNYQGFSVLQVFYISVGEFFGNMFSKNGLWSIAYILEVMAIAVLCLTGISLCIFDSLAKHLEVKKKPKRTFMKIILLYLLMFPVIILMVLLIFLITDYQDAVSITQALTDAESKLSTFLILLIVNAVLVMLNSAAYQSALKRISKKLNLD